MEKQHQNLESLIEELGIYSQKFLSVDSFCRRYHKKKGQVYIDLPKGNIPGAFKDGKAWLINAETYEEHLTKLSKASQSEIEAKNKALLTRLKKSRSC